MLTKEQESVIEGLRIEGIMSDEGMAAPDAQIAEAIESSFKDKTPPLKKSAVIMVGPPGAGKTREARNLYEQLPEIVKAGTIYAACNEGGAEDNYQPFLDAFHSASNNKQKLAVSKKFAPVTNRIMNDTMKRALLGEYSLIVDISGVGENDVKGLVETLRTAGYDDIEIMAIHARFDIAKDRAEKREWPSDSFNIVSKRITALDCLQAQSRQGDRFIFYSNNMITIDARKIFGIERGLRPVIFDARGLQQTGDDLTSDTAHIRHHLKELKKDRDYKGLIHVDDIMEQYERASNAALYFLQKVQQTGTIAAPEPTIRRLSGGQIASRSADAGSIAPS